jgi:hypothetical protein
VPAKRPPKTTAAARALDTQTQGPGSSRAASPHRPRIPQSQLCRGCGHPVSLAGGLLAAGEAGLKIGQPNLVYKQSWSREPVIAEPVMKNELLQEGIRGL